MSESRQCASCQGDKGNAPLVPDHCILTVLQRANGSDGQGQNRRREGSDGDISSLSDGRWAAGALQASRTHSSELWPGLCKLCLRGVGIGA